MGNGLSYFHSLSPFMETLWEQGSVLTEEERIREASESERREKAERRSEREDGGGGGCRNAAFSCFLWKRPCSVCVLHCLILPLAKATKASIYLS